MLTVLCRWGELSDKDMRQRPDNSAFLERMLVTLRWGCRLRNYSLQLCGQEQPHLILRGVQGSICVSLLLEEQVAETSGGAEAHIRVGIVRSTPALT